MVWVRAMAGKRMFLGKYFTLTVILSIQGPVVQRVDNAMYQPDKSLFGR